jgi:hypothetical protein
MQERTESTALSRVVRDKGQYVLAFAVIASLLVVVNIPIFVVFFFGVFAYFIAKVLSPGRSLRTRSVFEFYLSAHEILRDDMRRWYGFEINETIDRGERILKEMRSAPPLVHFALGALYNKVGDHSAAVKHLEYVHENPESFESTVVYPTNELRNYVNVLRKIEREPAEAPLTSAAIRSLERSRKLRGEVLLEQSRKIVNQLKVKQSDALPAGIETDTKIERSDSATVTQEIKTEPEQNGDKPDIREGTYLPAVFNEKPKSNDKEHGASRKSISEVLHDIYDRNVN